MSSHGLQIALASGARVIATSSSDEKLKVVSKLGAHHVINYKTTPNWHEKVLELTNGRGVDHIVEVRYALYIPSVHTKLEQVGGAESLEKSLKAVRIAGWIHTIGFVGGVCLHRCLLVQTLCTNAHIFIQGTPTDVVFATIRKACCIRGIQIGSVAQYAFILLRLLIITHRLQIQRHEQIVFPTP
jgi:NADPH:quinone reductase-like Zn-dependent oxidoreductase